MALVDLSVIEQRYRAVLEVEAGVSVTEVAVRFGVSRQSVHAWLRRYRRDGLGGLVDRSKRPGSCPHQLSAEVEALVCELRRRHPRWGPVRLVFELGRAGVEPVPSRMSVYRTLVRRGLIEPGKRRRRREDYRRWERSEPMALWQLDIVEGAIIATGAALLAISALRRVLRAEGLLLGVAAGALFGVSDVAIKYLTHAEGPLYGLLSPWTLTALVAGTIAFYASARSLQLGPGVEVIALTSVAANLAAILGGILVFDEPIGSGPVAIGARFVAFCLVIAGAALMPAQHTEQHEPEPGIRRASPHSF